MRSDDKTTSAEARLARLERRFRVLLGFLVVGALSYIVTLVAPSAQSATDEVRARRVVIVDAAGNIRTVISAPDKTQAGITVYDAGGRARVSLGLTPSDTILSGGPILGFYDKSGKKWQTSIYQTGTQGVIAVRDQDFLNSVTLTATPYFSSLSFYRRDPATQRVLTTAKLRASATGGILTLSNQRGKPLWSAP